MCPGIKIVLRASKTLLSVYGTLERRARLPLGGMSVYVAGTGTLFTSLHSCITLRVALGRNTKER